MGGQWAWRPDRWAHPLAFCPSRKGQGLADRFEWPISSKTMLFSGQVGLIGWPNHMELLWSIHDGQQALIGQRVSASLWSSCSSWASPSWVVSPLLSTKVWTVLNRNKTFIVTICIKDWCAIKACTQLQLARFRKKLFGKQLDRSIDCERCTFWHSSSKFNWFLHKSSYNFDKEQLRNLSKMWWGI